MKLSHPNIIKAYDFQHDATQVKPSGKKSKKTFMALELAEGGDFFEILQ